MINEIDDNDIFPTEKESSITGKQQEYDTSDDDESFIHKLDVGDDEIPNVEQTRLRKILRKYIKTSSRSSVDLGKTNIVRHKIEIVGDKHKRSPTRPLTPPQRKEMKKHLQEMEDAGIIRPSTSEYAAPVVLVKKKDNSTRFCVDYRLLNKVTRFNSYPLPKINDVINNLHGACIFSTLDMRSGYFQVEMDPADVHKTAFTTPYGLCEFTRMPQGMSGSASTFQRAMDILLANLQYESVIVYLDDVIVFATDYDQHLSRLEEVLKRLRDANLRLSPKKCHFKITSTILGSHYHTRQNKT